MNRELYPGIFDPDGRPWLGNSVAKRENYRRSLLWMLKVAALGQGKLVVPRGYIFDNPELQKVFQLFFADNAESQCFWLVMRDLLSVADAEGVAGADAVIDSESAWTSLLDDWIAGNGTKLGERRIRAYPNLLRDQSHLARYLRAQDNEECRDLFISFGESENRVNLRDLFGRLSKLNLRAVAKDGEFDFDARVRNALAGKGELSLAPRVRDKIEAIAEAGSRHGLPRISRSVLQNPNLCAETLGVPRDLVIGEDEYRYQAAPQLRHWHHLAFACSYGCGAICTETTANSDRRMLDTALGQVAEEIQETSPSWYSLSIGLERITFIDVWKVRNHEGFRPSLQRLQDAVQTGSELEFRESFDSHWRYVVGRVSFGLRTPDPDPEKLKALIADANSALTAGPLATAVTAVGFTRYLWSLGAGFAPYVLKELELRYFLRRTRRFVEEPFA